MKSTRSQGRVSITTTKSSDVSTSRYHWSMTTAQTKQSSFRFNSKSVTTRKDLHAKLRIKLKTSWKKSSFSSYKTAFDLILKSLNKLRSKNQDCSGHQYRVKLDRRFLWVFKWLSWRYRTGYSSILEMLLSVEHPRSRWMSCLSDLTREMTEFTL